MNGIENNDIFSGENSRELWASINKLDAMSTGDDMRDVLYSFGCALQRLESKLTLERTGEGDMYNLGAAGRYLAESHAYLARYMGADPESIPDKNKIELWRELIMRLCYQHKQAHEEIARLRKFEERWDYIKTDTAGARTLLSLLENWKGTADDFDAMIDKIIESRANDHQ